jgi:hypothetical protein
LKVSEKNAARLKSPGGVDGAPNLAPQVKVAQSFAANVANVARLHPGELRFDQSVPHNVPSHPLALYCKLNNP